MAQKLITAEEAANLLGISADALNDLRERREIFGYRDGSGWKFKQEDIERYAEDRAGGEMADSGVLSMPLDDEGDNASGVDDSVLLSEIALGESDPSSAGTVIGKPGDLQAAADSDIQLVEPDEKAEETAGSDLLLGKPDSDVTLVPDAGSDSSDSGVKLVPAGSLPEDDADEEEPPAGDPSNTVELELSDLALDSTDDSEDSQVPFDLEGSGVGSSAVQLGSEKEKEGKLESDSGSGGSELTLDSDAFADSALSIGSSLPLNEARESDSPSSGSEIELGDGAFEDDELVLGSGTGSDISDSGISLADPTDSGLSLEEPLELGGDEMLLDDGTGSGELTADDEFLLTPAVEMGDEDLDESGSQVIALDTEGEFDDAAATLLGEGLPEEGGLLEEDFGEAAPVMEADPLAGVGAMTGGAPLTAPTQTVAAREAPYSVWNVLSLFLCALLLTFTGMFMWDLLRHMWSWDQPYSFNSSLMDSIISMFEN